MIYRNLKSVLIISLVFLVSCGAWAHTAAESNEVVRIMLDASMNFPDNLDRESSRVHFRFYDPTVFFGMEVGQEWTPEGRRAAFEDFVEHMGTVDFNCATNVTCRQAAKAVAQCANFNFTNTVSALRRLSSNSTYPERFRVAAIRVAINLGGVCDETTYYVENVMTNEARYSMMERCMARGRYIELVQGVSSNETYSAATVNAGRMYYKYRLSEIPMADSIDKLLVSCLDGYVMSSNRLETACRVLSHSDADEEAVRYFTDVTNRLISTGQPLRVLNLEGAEQ